MNIGTSKLGLYIKRPDEVLPIDISFGKLHVLPRGATKITSASASVKRWKRKTPDKMEGANDFLVSTTPIILSPSKTSVRVTTTGGLDGYDYGITLVITFDNNVILEDTIYVRVKAPLRDINFISDTPSGGFDLTRLDDVTISLPTNNQQLKYNSTTQQWVNFNPSFTYAVFTVKDNHPPATNFATSATRNAISVLNFNDTTIDSAIFLSIMPQNVYLVDGLKIIIHWVSETAITGSCRWGVAIERCNTDLDSDSFAQMMESTSSTNAISGIINKTEIILTDIDQLLPEEMFKLKVFRNSTHVSDTIIGNTQLVAIEIRGV